MPRVSTYLNFMGNTEEAFNFYRSVFGTEFLMPIDHFDSAPPDPSQPELTDVQKKMVMNVQLPILGGHVLMGTDMVESMGFKLNRGNNVSINLEPDTLEEAKRLHEALSEGGSEVLPLEKMFWGDYWSSFVDKFGTYWMINCAVKE